MPTTIENLAGPTPVYWIGPAVRCDIDGTVFETVMYDARTDMGPWGLICPQCFERHGLGLGTGLGQRYERQEDGRWLKTGG